MFSNRMKIFQNSIIISFLYLYTIHFNLFSALSYNSHAIEDFKKRLLLEIPDKDLGPSILKLINK